jgi:hypothetical protein
MQERNLTLDNVLTEIRHHRPMSRGHLYRYFKRLKIKPLPVRQRPQRYPAGTASKVLKHLGFDPAAVTAGQVIPLGNLKQLSRRSRKGVK